jgi:major membrane immunogen (membrane-anchored lipoprotein)
MKTILTTIICSIIFLTSCGDSSTSNSETLTLDGKWEIVEAEGFMAESNVGTEYIFEEGKLTFSKDGFDNKANSTKTDSTFTWDNGSMVMDYNYKFEGNQLIVNPAGSDQKLILERK